MKGSTAWHTNGSCISTTLPQQQHCSLPFSCFSCAVTGTIAAGTAFCETFCARSMLLELFSSGISEKRGPGLLAGNCGRAARFAAASPGGLPDGVDLTSMIAPRLVDLKEQVFQQWEAERVVPKKRWARHGLELSPPTPQNQGQQDC